MRGIHSRFGLDCLLRSSPTSPCTSRDKTLNIIYGINAFTKKSLWRSFLALMIWIFPIWYLARKKCFKVRLRRRFCLWLEWEVFDKWSLDFPICLTWVSLFIQTFRRDPFAPTDPSICYWHGGAGEERQYSGHFHFFKHLIDQKLQMCNALSCSETPCFCHYCEIPLFSFDRQWLCLYSCQRLRDSSPQLGTITEIMSTSLPRCQTSSHLHINTIVFNVNICIDGGKHHFGETTQIQAFNSLSWFLTQWYRNADVLL